jgi:hypothetical protein
MADEKREMTAHGQPAPTLEEARNELKIMEALLDKHGCPTTRGLIAMASLVVDVSHRDAHSRPIEAVTKATTERAMPILGDALKQMAKTEFDDPESQAKWYARMATILLNQAQLFATMAVKTSQYIQPDEKIVKVAEPVDPTQPLVQMKIPNKYVN